MQHFEVSGAVRSIYVSLGVKPLTTPDLFLCNRAVDQIPYTYSVFINKTNLAALL